MNMNTLFFDVNETLLDLAPVRKSVEKKLKGNTEGVVLWFKSLLHRSLVYSAGETFQPFGQLAADALQNVARSYEIELAEHQAEEAIKPILRCEPHEDVESGLDKLRQKGYRLCALTNSSTDALKQQMEHSGLGTYFEKALSVEQIGIYKPHKKVYEWAAKQVGEQPKNCAMIAAHDWDVMGAKWAGFTTVYVKRSYVPIFSPSSVKPDLIANRIDVLAEQL